MPFCGNSYVKPSFETVGAMRRFNISACVTSKLKLEKKTYSFQIVTSIHVTCFFFAGDLHCFSVPSANQKWTNSGEFANEKQSVDSSPVRFQSTSCMNGEGGKSEQKLLLSHNPCSPVTRATLSQPCMSENKSVVATSIFPHLFLGSQQDVTDEVKLQ